MIIFSLFYWSKYNEDDLISLWTFSLAAALGAFSLQQQEQDPTNLYMANLPPHFKENDVDQLLAKFGQVVSTRILRDTHGQSKGVGFARMESREKCEQIIQVSYLIKFYYKYLCLFLKTNTHFHFLLLRSFATRRPR